MAANVFLKLDDVTGESQVDGHTGEIDVLSWSWGMSQSGTTHMGSGGGSGKVNVQDISITKYVDSSSPTLQKFCSNGKHLATGKLALFKMGEDPLEYMKIELEEVLIASVSLGGSGGDDRMMETISLNFGKFKTTYTLQESAGTGGAPVIAGWDISGNKDNS